MVDNLCTGRVLCRIQGHEKDLLGSLGWPLGPRTNRTKGGGKAKIRSTSSSSPVKELGKGRRTKHLGKGRRTKQREAQWRYHMKENDWGIRRMIQKLGGGLKPIGST